MNVVLFGGTGMVGGGVLRECLDDPRVERVLAVGRRSTGMSHPKLREMVRKVLLEFDDVRGELEGYDACFYCLGVSSAGLDEATYRRVTYDLAVAAANVLIELNPGLAFCFVSGLGTDGSGTSGTMWARVKGETENRLLEMTQRAYMFRPGFIQPMRGVRSSTTAYRIFYAITGPLFPILRRLFPRTVTTTVRVGQAMIQVAAQGAEMRVLETSDINAVAEG
ncbi:MAG: epimerase [Gemmatimonadota bacterium]